MNNQDTIKQLYLCHFNPNHDPRTGQFAKSSSGGVIDRAYNKWLSRRSEDKLGKSLKKINDGRKAMKERYDRLDENSKRTANVAGVAGAAAAISAIATVKNFKAAERIMQGEIPGIKLSRLDGVSKGIVKAGAVAAAGALATVAAYKISDLSKAYKNTKTEAAEKTPGSKK